MTKQTVLITGASSGFGALTARALAEAGHVVYAGIRDTAGRNRPAVQEAARYASEHTVDLRTVELDVSSEASVDVGVAQVVEETDGIDILVHNAGHAFGGPAEAFTPQELTAAYDINVLSTQRVNRAALPHMRKRGRGLVLWVGSSSTRGGTRPFVAPYFAAKAAEDAFAVSYAGELAKFGIETTIVVPGFFPTGTNHIAHTTGPADTDLAAEYDVHYKDLMAKSVKLRDEAMPEGLDAADVARAIVDVVDTPHGSRPFRVHVDPLDDGAELVNGVGDRIRSDSPTASSLSSCSISPPWVCRARNPLRRRSMRAARFSHSVVAVSSVKPLACACWIASPASAVPMPIL